MNSADLLFELGCEELPPKSLRKLRDALAAGIENGLKDARLAHGAVEKFASPRRLAVIVRDLPFQQPDQLVEKLGPNVKAAFTNGDGDGAPTPAALGFARSCGVEFDQLGRKDTDKGERLAYSAIETGQAAADLLPGIINESLKRLPIAKRMRWGNGSAEFVRPVHWVVFLHGEEIVETSILDVAAGNQSRGHRFHAPDPISINNASEYQQALLNAKVVADFETRQAQVKEAVENTAASLGGQARIDNGLLEEVSALVEWPVPISGGFEDKFMAMPPEVITTTIEDHQKYFPVEDKDGNLLPHFITLSNLESSAPEEIQKGNERVVKPRLEDALFFWEQDNKEPLISRLEKLQTVVFQKELGTLAGKTERVAALGIELAKTCNGNAESVETAAKLSRCDLLTHAVYEMPELQGRMGYYYALNDGHSTEIAEAIEGLYQPRFAGDDLPSNLTGSLLSLADKLDTLAGIFAIGKKPTGDKDPFALRRAAIGVLRLCQELPLTINLEEWLAKAVAAQPVTTNADEITADLITFISERARVLAKDQGIDSRAFSAVLEIAPLNPADIQTRAQAVNDFMQSEAAASLSEANKRAGNILRKQEASEGSLDIDSGLLNEAAEQALQTALQNTLPLVEAAVAKQAYAEALNALTALAGPLDQFFTDVMVMADDEAVRNNRLALLRNIRKALSSVADISLLQS
jgi:glycyl-tRNA synthetase beta chain